MPPGIHHRNPASAPLSKKFPVLHPAPAARLLYANGNSSEFVGSTLQSKCPTHLYLRSALSAEIILSGYGSPPFLSIKTFHITKMISVFSKISNSYSLIIIKSLVFFLVKNAGTVQPSVFLLKFLMCFLALCRTPAFIRPRTNRRRITSPSQREWCARVRLLYKWQ